jgi:hypothetical protein
MLSPCNNSANRWAFKPEFGYSERCGHWVLDAYAAVWFFTTNPEFFSHNAFFPGTNTQSQKPIFAFEGHLSYDAWGPLFQDVSSQEQDIVSMRISNLTNYVKSLPEK